MTQGIKILLTSLQLFVFCLPTFGNNMPNSRLDSVTICLNSSFTPNHQLTVVLKNGTCHVRVDSIQRYSEKCSTDDNIYTINNKLLERTIYLNVSYESIDKAISTVLTSLVNELFIQRTERILQSYNSEGFGLLHNRLPTTVIIVKLHYTDEIGYNEVSFEIEDYGNYTSNAERLMMADYRQYTPTCRKLIVLLHYVALKSNIKIAFEQDVINYVKHSFPNILS